MRLASREADTSGRGLFRPGSSPDVSEPAWNPPVPGTMDPH